MARPTEITGEIVKRALAEYGQCWPSRSIAGWLMEKHPGVFKNFEAACSVVRYYRGAVGKKNRNDIASKSFFKAHGHGQSYNIPLPAALTDIENWDVYPVEFNKALLLQDIHIPYHDPVALEIALAHGQKEKVDAIIINGDAADFYSISFWENDPTKRNFVEEIERVRLFEEHLRGRFPKARIIYKEGNHEERLWRYAWRKCPELYALKDGEGKQMINLASLLDAKNYGIEVVTDKRPILCGDHLHVLHGHEFGRPLDRMVNAARGLYLRAKCNAVCGDVHNSSNHVETGLNSIISAWSSGCLCNLRPRYMPINKWNHGFGIIHLHKKNWSFENLKIINGTVVGA